MTAARPTALVRGKEIQLRTRTAFAARDCNRVNAARS